MMTMTELKNHFDMVHELVGDTAFVKTVYHAVKSQGCTDEEWEANKMPILVRMANDYLNKLAQELKKV